MKILMLSVSLISLALSCLAGPQITERQQQMIRKTAHPTDTTFVPEYPKLEALQAIQRDFLQLPRPIGARIVKEGGNDAPPGSYAWVAPTIHVELTGSGQAFNQSHSYRDTLMALCSYIHDPGEGMCVAVLLCGMTNMTYYPSPRLLSFPATDRKAWKNISPENVRFENDLLAEKVRNEISGQLKTPFGAVALERLLQREPTPLLHRKDVPGKTQGVNAQKAPDGSSE